LLLPWLFIDTLEKNEELTLEVEELVEIWEQIMDGILVDYATGTQSRGIFLKDNTIMISSI
jgi:hypothetical protein